MKNSLYCGAFAGFGSAVYQILVHGLSGADFYRSVFIGLFVALVFMLFNGYGWLMSKNKQE